MIDTIRETVHQFLVPFQHVETKDSTRWKEEINTLEVRSEYSDYSDYSESSEKSPLFQSPFERALCKKTEENLKF